MTRGWNIWLAQIEREDIALTEVPMCHDPWMIYPRRINCKRQPWLTQSGHSKNYVRPSNDQLKTYQPKTYLTNLWPTDLWWVDLREEIKAFLTRRWPLKMGGKRLSRSLLYFFFNLGWSVFLPAVLEYISGPIRNSNSSTPNPLIEIFPNKHSLNN